MKNILVRITAPLAAVLTVTALLVSGQPLLVPSEQETAPVATVSVPPSQLTLVCPGALLRVGGTDGIDPDLRERIGEAALGVARSATQSVSLDGGELNFVGETSIQSLDSSGVLRLTELAQSQGSANLAGSQLQDVEVARMQGLAASNCIQPAAESWFVAGSTAPGSETVLIVVNPSVIASTVTVTAHGSTGDTNSGQVVVPAGETRLFQVDNLVNAEGEFTLHVTAGQGKVAAFLQQRQTSGLSASGVALATPAASANLKQVLPGILVRGSELRAEGQAGNWIRIFNPGDTAAELLIEVVGSNTEEFGGVLQATVSAKNTVDIPLVGLPDGNYAAFITSDQPVLAGALSQGAVTLEYQDIAWSQSAQLQTGSFALAVPDAPAGSKRVGLQLTNPLTTPVTLSVTSGDQTTAYVLPPNSTGIYPVVTGVARVASSTDGIVANLIVDSALGFDVIAAGLNQNLGSELEVRVLR